MDIIIIIRSDNKTSGWLHFLNLEVRRVNVLQVREVLDDIVEFRIVFSSHKVVYELICFWHSFHKRDIYRPGGSSSSSDTAASSKGEIAGSYFYRGSPFGSNPKLKRSPTSRLTFTKNI